MAEPTRGAGKDNALEQSASQDHEKIPQEPEEELVTFLDRCIAFMLLVGPWSYLTALAQGLLKDLLSVKIVNMVVLAGIILFLVAVGRLSKWIYLFRSTWRKEEPDRESTADADSRPNTLD